MVSYEMGKILWYLCTGHPMIGRIVGIANDMNGQFIVESLNVLSKSYLYSEDLFNTYQEIKMEAVKYRIKELLEHISRIKEKRFYTDIGIY